MAQIFTPQANLIAKLVIVGGLLSLGIIGVAAEFLTRSTYNTDLRKVTEQPVPFSHKHHVKGLGLDCRFCHASVSTSAHAGMPPTATCMGCHSQIWVNSNVLKPVRDSFVHHVPLQWNRVYRLPDYVYFDHSIHISKGVGCVTCHGHIETMPLVEKVRSFTMNDCLSCHRHPEDFVRPKEEVFNPDWRADDQKKVGNVLIRAYRIDSHRITNCSTCHR